MRASIFALAIAVVGCGSAETPDTGGATDAQTASAGVTSDQGSSASGAVTQLGAVDIDLTRLASARAGDAFDLNLGAAGSVAVRTIAVERLGEGRYSWTAHTIGQGAPDGEATLVVDGAAVTGSIRTPEGVLYRIKPSEQGNTIERVDGGQMPPD